MKSKKLRKPLMLLLLLALALFIYLFVRELAPKKEEEQSFNGTIEAVQVSVAAEVSGRVASVSFAEGDAVNAGDILFQMDPTLVQAQQQIALQNLELANAALTTARAQYTLTQNSVTLQSAGARTADWNKDAAGEDIAGNFSQAELIAASETEVAAALQNRDDRQASLNELLAKPVSAEFAAAEARLLAATTTSNNTFQVVQKALLSGNTDLINAAQDAFDSADSELDEAQSAYDDLKDSGAAKKILKARARLAVAQERYDMAVDNLLKLQYGSQSAQLAAAQAAVDQAQSAVNQAQAQVDLVNIQSTKLTLISPTSGTVITRLVEPGEVIAQGAAAMVLVDLSALELTVYLPEDIYGQVSLGQKALITVDSYPGEIFSATVSHIADQAEFTPRNVQTVEGRKTTVFAIKLSIDNPGRKLKPGMPADVTFVE